MPCDYSKYPDNWRELRETVLERAGNKCEGSPKYPKCRAENYQPHPETGSKVILTIAHMNHDHTDNRIDNLRALCQRCHLTHDAKQHAENANKTRFNRKHKEELRKLKLWEKMTE